MPKASTAIWYLSESRKEAADLGEVVIADQVKRAGVVPAEAANADRANAGPIEMTGHLRNKTNASRDRARNVPNR